MTERIQPFPDQLANLNKPSYQHYPFMADIETETARIALIGVSGHHRNSRHKQYPVLNGMFNRFVAQSSAEEADVTCYYEGGPRPPGETSPDNPAKDAIAHHAESGWLIRAAREQGLEYKSWDLLMSDGIDALMSLYKGDHVAWTGDYQLPEYVYKLWTDEETFGNWLAYRHREKHSMQWLGVKRRRADPGDPLSYTLKRLEAHGAIEAFKRNGIDVTNRSVFEAIHKEVCAEAEVDEKHVPLNPQGAPEDTGPDAYFALHTAPFSRSPRRADSLTKLQHIGNIADSVLRDLHFADLISNLLAQNTNAFMIAGGWHGYYAPNNLHERGQQVERTTWHVGMAACREAFKAQSLA